jgi:hypothetical protein
MSLKWRKEREEEIEGEGWISISTIWTEIVLSCFSCSSANRISTRDRCAMRAASLRRDLQWIHQH